MRPTNIVGAFWMGSGWQDFNDQSPPRCDSHLRRQGDRMKRRIVLGSMAAAAISSGAARAQQRAVPVVGFLGNSTPGLGAHLLAALRQGLSETGYLEGQNVVIEWRWAEGHYDRLPAMAADLVGRKANVIVAIGLPAAHAAKIATSTIPIVFTSADAVGD